MKEYKKFYGNYVGIVIQNDDPDRSGKVKVFVPHVSATVYSKWVANKQNKKFKFIGSNLDTTIQATLSGGVLNNYQGLTPIVEELKIVLPWAYCASPLTSEDSSGRYNNYNSFGSISDSNYYSTFSQSTTGAIDTPGKPGAFYEDPNNRLSDAFVNAAQNINRPNPLAFEYVPNTYSNRAKGSFGIPAVGSHVWVFFREGNPTLPVYFAVSRGQVDWSGIYDSYNNPGIDYPETFENRSSSNTPDDVNVDTYRNKYVINQKGGTIEVTNTDLKEKLKFTHYSGSFKEFNNQSNIELAVNNDQKLVLNDSYETVRGFKNIWVGKSLDENVIRDRYTKIGSLSAAQAMEDWKNAYAPIQDNKQLFEIQRAVPSNVEDPYGHIVIRRNSPNQTRVGSFAPHPAINQTYYALNEDSSFLPDLITKTMGDIANSFANGPLRLNVVSLPAQPTTFPNLTNYTNESGITWSGVPGLSPSSQDGVWVIDPRKELIKTLTELTLPKLTAIEKNLGIGGSEIIQIAKHKVETIGLTVNDYGSIRYDDVGKMLPSEMLIDNLGTYVNYSPSPLIELVHVQDLPGGDFTLNVCNRYNVMVGAGGLNLKSMGPTNITGTVTNVTGEQVNISSENEININASTVNISAEILRLRNTNQKQIFIENSLGVTNNVVVGGSISVEGELFVQHVTAPAEYQVTQPTTAYGQIQPGTVTEGIILIGPIGATVKTSPQMAQITSLSEAEAATGEFVGGGGGGGLLAAVIAKINASTTGLKVQQDGTIGGFIVAPYVSVTGLASNPNAIAVSDHSHVFRNLPLTLHDANTDVRKDAQEINQNTSPVAASRRVHGLK